ncbi:methyl-accepting chemotaxis protein [Vitiosangium sp. GDMCC 1.1324]|uniref:methyl-accepting chemotaxis protein n=1 Tax=Vitiosangium sp. (strain GDMCC 1.1324) TaxID=2138576 RepID=UPI000D3A162F|nr:methyl-accepting chemotaxis protein [Vitiosangium sp. GDMCC 1.1324]PTL80371.1 methyl-accepting chemotaxis protein [Vitiosangium sp. GDMCC 1.1324]
MNLPFLGDLKLRGRITLSVALLSALSILSVSFLGLSFTRRTLSKQIHSTLQVEAEGLKDLVERTLAEREASVRSWSEDSILRGALLFDTYDKSDAVLAGLVKRHPSISGFVLLDEQGRAVSASSEQVRKAFQNREREVRETAWYRAALEGRFTAESLSDDKDPAFGRRVLPLAAPVLSPLSGKRIGVLLAAYNWSQVGDVVRSAVERAQRRGQSSFALEVRKADGSLLFDSRPADAAPLEHPVSEEAINGTEEQDVGDGWHFVARVDAREAYAPLAEAATIALGLIGLFLGLAIVGSWWLARSIARPITALSQAVTHVIQEGDLSHRVQVETRDEVGELAQAFARMMDHLRETTLGLQQGTQVLTGAMAELDKAAELQERNLARQASAIQETQVTAQEIRQTSQMAAERSQTVLEVASRAEQVGNAGESTLAASLQGLHELHEKVGKLATTIISLGERTQQIGSIAQTVKDLADQSNMLALNAAIEAVRSGEHGKGFGVVAREIRALADQSIDSTDRVRELLDDIGHSIQATVVMTEKGQRQMQDGLAQIRASGESLRELTAIVRDNAGAARQIAVAVNQQNAGISQIFTAVTDLSSLMDETMQGVQAITRATGSLREAAERMETVARTYRV